jgi:hypothetical protein
MNPYTRDLDISIPDIGQIEGRILRGLGVKKPNPQRIPKVRLKTRYKNLAHSFADILKHGLDYSSRPRKVK